MKKYGMDLVVANELHTRRTKAYIYNTEDKHETCECKEGEDLEAEIVKEVVKAHNKYCLL